MEKAQLPRHNARWHDPNCEDFDCLHLADTTWRSENNYCNPPWPALPLSGAKLLQFGGAATVVAPYWPHKSRYKVMHNLAIETVHYPATRDRFFPGRYCMREGVARPN
jgi:hypothetical protein